MESLRRLVTTRANMVALAIVLISAGSLATAFIAQYGFGLEPCILCIYQRIAYAVAGALGIFALVLKGKPKVFVSLIFLCALAFAVESALAFYHVGVEQKWWVSTCSGISGAGMDLADLKAALMNAPLKRCDDIAWTIFGLSITVYNAILAFGYAVLTLLSALWMKDALQQGK